MNTFKETSRFPIKSPLLSGLVYAFVTMGITAVLAATVVAMSDVGDNHLKTWAYVMHGISILIGSFIAGRYAAHKGWYYGGVMGLLYSVIVLVVSFLSFDRGMDLAIFLFMGFSFIVGAVGGIMGVNTKK